MKIEYIAKGGWGDCPLIRIFDFDTTQVSLLHDGIVELSNRARTSVDVNAFPWVEAVGQCRLVLGIAKWDRGVVQDGPNSFRYMLTPETWDNVAGLMEPFLTDVSPNRFQWLDSTYGFSVLLSPDGRW